MEVFYSNVNWYGKDKTHLYASDLQIDYIDYGNVIMNIEDNVFAKKLLDYLNQNNIDIPVLELNGQPVLNETSNDEMVSRAVTDAVQTYLDSVAKEKRYDNALTLATYATSSNPTFASEAKKFIEYRDVCWSTCYDILAKYEKREVPMPTPDEVIKQFPKIQWE